MLNLTKGQSDLIIPGLQIGIDFNSIKNIQRRIKVLDLTIFQHRISFKAKVKINFNLKVRINSKVKVKHKVRINFKTKVKTNSKIKVKTNFKIKVKIRIKVKVKLKAKRIILTGVHCVSVVSSMVIISGIVQ